MTPPQVSVVVPLLDEAATLRELVARIRSTLDERGVGAEIVLVDDGSSDDTAAIIRDLEAQNASVRGFAFPRSFGQAAAIACGLVEARGEVVVTMDGDLQNPPEEIHKLLDAIEAGAAVASGRRGTRHEKTWRWLGSRLVHWTAVYLTGVRIEDFGGQFKAYRRDVIDTTMQMWTPGSAFFPLALWLGFPVTEVVVRHDSRKRGHSRYTFASLVRVNIDLITGFTTLPLAALGVLGCIGMAGGGGGILWVVATGATGGFGASLSLLLFGVGAVFFACGVVGQYLARLYRHLVGGGLGYVVSRRPSGGRESRAGLSEVASLRDGTDDRRVGGSAA